MQSRLQNCTEASASFLLPPAPPAPPSAALSCGERESWMWLGTGQSAGLSGSRAVWACSLCFIYSFLKDAVWPHSAKAFAWNICCCVLVVQLITGRRNSD